MSDKLSIHNFKILMSLAPLKKILKKIVNFGTKCYCPVCESHLQTFKPMKTLYPRLNAICPICNSLERHRMIWLFLNQETDLFSPRRKKMLHIAPENCFVQKLSQYPSIDYLTADLNNSAMVKMDLTNIQYPDNSFDIIYCSHVLEHILDDQKAMRELARVLCPSGWAILQVPILRDITFEDPNATDPKERERLFGQFDHVRVYGSDYKNRLEDAGFFVKRIPYLEQYDQKVRHRYGLNIEKDDIYFCQSK